MVPVLDPNLKPLMPCSEKRARKLLERSDAKPYWKQGVFCIVLQRPPSGYKKQPVVVAIDPGTKRTGVTVATEKRVVFNLLLTTPDWITEKLKDRKSYRKFRRARKSPTRKQRNNRAQCKNTPASKALWETHIRVIDVISFICPVTELSIEEIKAKTREGSRNWNKNFTPLQMGKFKFFEQVKSLGLNLYRFSGYETFMWRNYRGFQKTSDKLADKWEAHNVDSHCLAEMVFNDIPVFKNLIKCTLFNFHKRKLRLFNCKKGGLVQPYGGTISCGIKRGSLVRHKKYGLCTIGGSSRNRVSLHDLTNNKRLSQYGRVDHCVIKSRMKWRPVLIKENER